MAKRPEKKAAPSKPPEIRVLPMELRICDRLVGETAEWEVTGRPFTTAGGKMAHARVKKVDQPDVTEIRSLGCARARRGETRFAEGGRVMTWMVAVLLIAVSLSLSGCGAEGQTPLSTQTPLSMQVIVLNAAQLPDGGKWNDLLRRPLVAVEYATRPDVGSGGRTLYLYDARWGECRVSLRRRAVQETPC
jgi:hypothetical protein